MSELSKAIQPVMAEPKQIAPSSNFLLGHHPWVHIAFVNAQVTSQRRSEAQTLYSRMDLPENLRPCVQKRTISNNKTVHQFIDL